MRVDLEVEEEIHDPIPLARSIIDSVQHDDEVNVRFLVRLTVDPGAKQDDIDESLAELLAAARGEWPPRARRRRARCRTSTPHARRHRTRRTKKASEVASRRRCRAALAAWREAARPAGGPA